MQLFALLALMLGSMLVQWDNHLKMTFSLAVWAEKGVEVENPVASIGYGLQKAFTSFQNTYLRNLNG